MLVLILTIQPVSVALDSHSIQCIFERLTQQDRVLLSIPNPVCFLLDLEIKILNILSNLLALHILVETHIVPYSHRCRSQHMRALRHPINNKTRMIPVHGVILPLQSKIIPNSLRNISADLLRAIGGVHARADHEERALGVRFRNAYIGDIVAHAAEDGVYACGDLEFEIEAFECGDFVADVGRVAAADVGADVRDETALLAEGEVDSCRCRGAVHAGAFGEGGVIGVEWPCWAAVVVEVD